MPKAVWNGQVLAESDDTVEMEGNHYFPRDSVRREFLRDSDATSVCPWKGEARYYTVEVDGRRLEDGAFYYPKPSEKAHMLKDRITFWKGVRVSP